MCDEYLTGRGKKTWFILTDNKAAGNYALVVIG